MQETVDNLAEELPDAVTLREQIGRCPPSVVRQMAYELMQAAVKAHATSDLNALGQTMVDWASTVEIEQDAALRRRLARRRTTSATQTPHD